MCIFFCSGGWQNASVYQNVSTSIDSSGNGSGIRIDQGGADGTALYISAGSNVNASTNGLFNTTIGNTQSAATVMQKIDMGTSAQAHTGIQFEGNAAAKVFEIDGNLTQAGGTATGTTTKEIKITVDGVAYVIECKSEA